MAGLDIMPLQGQKSRETENVVATVTSPVYQGGGGAEEMSRNESEGVRLEKVRFTQPRSTLMHHLKGGGKQIIKRHK